MDITGWHGRQKSVYKNISFTECAEPFVLVCGTNDSSVNKLILKYTENHLAVGTFLCVFFLCAFNQYFKVNVKRRKKMD